jgi:hypothetical protein
MRVGLGIAMAALMSGSAAAADLSGEWRAACGAEAGDTSVVLEYAFTGGTAAIDNGMEEESGTFPIVELEKQGKLSLKDGVVKWQGQTFKRCRGPADRSAIKLSKAQLAEIATTMPPAYPVFVDARAKAGCKARDYQYLRIDLIGPLGFELGRWNSLHLGELLAGDGKPPLPVDEVSNWKIEKAESVPGGYKLTITELIPPNGSRGDTTTITLATSSGGKLSVPEWKRSYIRCAEGSGIAD